jgi:hypothetical protein
MKRNFAGTFKRYQFLWENSLRCAGTQGLGNNWLVSVRDIPQWQAEVVLDGLASFLVRIAVVSVLHCVHADINHNIACKREHHANPALPA